MSFLSCFFDKTESRLKDISPFCRKDSIKKLKSLIREQYVAPPLDGCNIVKFLENKNRIELSRQARRYRDEASSVPRSLTRGVTRALEEYRIEAKKSCMTRGRVPFSVQFCISQK